MNELEDTEYTDNDEPLAELCMYWIMDEMPSNEWLQQMERACNIRIQPILKKPTTTTTTRSKKRRERRKKLFANRQYPHIVA